MDDKKDFKTTLKMFSPSYVIAGSKGGVKFVMLPNIATNTIHWSVVAGDHETEFTDFDDAVDYYWEQMGE